jgi:hypothetical protein
MCLVITVQGLLTEGDSSSNRQLGSSRRRRGGLERFSLCPGSKAKYRVLLDELGERFDRGL